MSDCMTFPDTVEEFMEQYKITDTKHIYTNGTELIPVFRMKQWFEHQQATQPEIVRCKDCAHADKYYHCDYMNKWNTPDGYCYCAKKRRK